MIGLREGLEAGLIVTILVSAVRKLAPERSLAPVWIGVAAALALSLSFGFVLTFTASKLSSSAQAAFVGFMSVIAVGLITWMVFFMRKTAATMAGDIKGKMSEALILGSAALAVTSFVAVAREGLETALFVWTNLQAASESAGPIIGAIIGLGIAVALCIGIYKRAIKLNFKKFFTITGSILIVISAGVLAYGIGDLQEAGILPGQTNKAFDVSAAINNSTWWFQIIRGVFNIDTIMTWFQVVAYVLYLSITLTVFLVTGRSMAPAGKPAGPAADGAKTADAASTTAAVPAAGAVAAGAVLATSAADGSSTGTVSAPAASSSGGEAGATSDAASDASTASDASAASDPATTPGGSGADGGSDQPPTTDGPTPAPGAPEPMSTGKKWSIGGAIVAVPVVLAVIFVMLVGGSGGSTTQSIQVTQDACVPSWNAPPAGQSTFNIKNASTSATDIELVTHPGGLIVAEIEVLGPSTSRDLPVNLAEGEYQWRCVTGGEQATYSSVQTTSGGAVGQGSYAFAPVTIEEITPYLEQYRVYVGAQLKILDGQVVALKNAVDSGNREAAKNAWLPGQLTYHRIGAAYGAFGEDGDAVNGLAQSLPEGVNDPEFVGFHKIEYQLWSGAPMAQIKPQAADLVDAVRNLEKQLPKFTFDALEVVTRAHEILEDTQRFVVTGQDDYGSGTSYAHAVADTEGTRTLIGILAPMLETRQPTLVPTANPELDQLQAALIATKRNGQWVPVSQMDLAVRMPTNAALGQVLETIAPIPDILEIQA